MGIWIDGQKELESSRHIGGPGHPIYALDLHLTMEVEAAQNERDLQVTTLEAWYVINGTNSSEWNVDCGNYCM